MNDVKEALTTIRRIAMNLPIGKRNQVLNRCDRIHILMRHTHPEDPRTPGQMSESIVEHYATTKRIVAALLAGRELSYKDMKEFKTVEWHTRICEAKAIIAKRYPEYTFLSRWATGDKHPYKIYWLEDKVI